MGAWAVTGEEITKRPAAASLSASACAILSRFKPEGNTHTTMRGLKGKGVLITGGASGIGAAAAARFLEEGSRVCVLDRDAAACAKIRHELPGLTESIIADVTDLMQVEAAFAEAIRLMDGVDVLIN